MSVRCPPAGLWRYFELLPVRDPANIVSLGEGSTPLIPALQLGAMLGLKHLYIKDERQGPTRSFKDRQASVALSVMNELGIREMVAASTGKHWLPSSPMPVIPRPRSPPFVRLSAGLPNWVAF